MTPRHSGGGKNLSELDLQFPLHRYRKLRLYFAWVFVIATAILAKSTDRGFFASIPLLVMGEALRVWSQGYLRKARELATDGPYAYVRNPLYLGNFFIGLGFCVIIWHPLIISIFVMGFFAVYCVAIKGEEQRLRFKFKAAYENYARSVPRFVPRFPAYPKRSNARFATHRIVGHGEHITVLGIIALYVILYLRQQLYQEQKPFSSLTYWFLTLAITLGLAIVFSMWFRYRPKRRQ